MILLQRAQPHQLQSCSSRRRPNLVGTRRFAPALHTAATSLAQTGDQAENVTKLNALQITAPFVLPATAAVAAAVYSGALLPGLESWAKSLAVAAGPLMLHGVLPLVDWIVGARAAPQPLSEKAPPPDDLAARIIPTLTVLAHLVLTLCAYAAIATAPLQPGLLPLLALSLTSSATVALAASHELVHSRNPAHLAVAATFLTAYWWYPYYRAHHQHHLHVGTPADYVTAHKGSNPYLFALNYIAQNYREAIKLSAEECDRAGQPQFSIHNASLVALAAQALLTGCLFAAFGPVVGGVHLGCVALLLVNMALFDYVLHYGLYRPALAGKAGRFAPVTQYNSWNSLYAVENAALFNALYHSDHHVVANRGGYWLRSDSETPRFPAPLLVLILATLVPPLWERIMDSQVDQVNNKNVEHLKTMGVEVAQ